MSFSSSLECNQEKGFKEYSFQAKSLKLPKEFGVSSLSCVSCGPRTALSFSSGGSGCGTRRQEREAGKLLPFTLCRGKAGSRLTFLRASQMGILLLTLLPFSLIFWKVLTGPPGLLTLSTTDIWNQIILCNEGCFVHCRTFSSIHGLHSQDDSRNLIPKLWQEKNIPKHGQMSPWQQE